MLDIRKYLNVINEAMVNYDPDQGFVEPDTLDPIPEWMRIAAVEAVKYWPENFADKDAMDVYNLYYGMDFRKFILATYNNARAANDSRTADRLALVYNQTTRDLILAVDEVSPTEPVQIGDAEELIHVTPSEAEQIKDIIADTGDGIVNFNQAGGKNEITMTDPNNPDNQTTVTNLSDPEFQMLQNMQNQGSVQTPTEEPIQVNPDGSEDEKLLQQQRLEAEYQRYLNDIEQDNLAPDEGRITQPDQGRPPRTPPQDSEGFDDGYPTTGSGGRGGSGPTGDAEGFDDGYPTTGSGGRGTKPHSADKPGSGTGTGAGTGPAGGPASGMGSGSAGSGLDSGVGIGGTGGAGDGYGPGTDETQGPNSAQGSVDGTNNTPSTGKDDDWSWPRHPNTYHKQFDEPDTRRPYDPKGKPERGPGWGEIPGNPFKRSRTSTNESVIKRPKEKKVKKGYLKEEKNMPTLEEVMRFFGIDEATAQSVLDIVTQKQSQDIQSQIDSTLLFDASVVGEADLYYNELLFTMLLKGSWRINIDFQNFAQKAKTDGVKPYTGTNITQLFYKQYPDYIKYVIQFNEKLKLLDREVLNNLAKMNSYDPELKKFVNWLNETDLSQLQKMKSMKSEVVKENAGILAAFKAAGGDTSKLSADPSAGGTAMAAGQQGALQATTTPQAGQQKGPQGNPATQGQPQAAPAPQQKGPQGNPATQGQPQKTTPQAGQQAGQQATTSDANWDAEEAHSRFNARDDANTQQVADKRQAAADAAADADLKQRKAFAQANQAQGRFNTRDAKISRDETRKKYDAQRAKYDARVAQRNADPSAGGTAMAAGQQGALQATTAAPAPQQVGPQGNPNTQGQPQAAPAQPQAAPAQPQAAPAQPQTTTPAQPQAAPAQPQAAAPKWEVERVVTNKGTTSNVNVKKNRNKPYVVSQISGGKMAKIYGSEQRLKKFYPGTVIYQPNTNETRHVNLASYINKL